MLVLLFVTAGQAQEVTNGTLSGNRYYGTAPDYRQVLNQDSMKLTLDPIFTEPSISNEMPANRGDYHVPSTRQSIGVARLWDGATVGVHGSMDHMPGLLDIHTGSVALYQDLGRLHITLSADANKYWMPMQSTLLTQYGFGGHLSYDVNDWMTLHAFGNYYTGQQLYAPAVSPYVNTTSFGGYADIRFSDHWGANVGARRYINPMTGRWETVPIINPYFKFNNGVKIELPLGELLREIIVSKRRQPPMMMMPPPHP